MWSVKHRLKFLPKHQYHIFFYMQTEDSKTKYVSRNSTTEKGACNDKNEQGKLILASAIAQTIKRSDSQFGCWSTVAQGN